MSDADRRIGRVNELTSKMRDIDKSVRKHGGRGNALRKKAEIRKEISKIVGREV